jgi:hypothetical protein
MNPTTNLTILAGADGGIIIYEAVPVHFDGASEQKLVFGGNLEEASKYLTRRMQGLLDDNAKKEPNEVEPIFDEIAYAPPGARKATRTAPIQRRADPMQHHDPLEEITDH